MRNAGSWSFYICPPFPRGTPRFLRQGVHIRVDCNRYWYFSGLYNTPESSLPQGTGYYRFFRYRPLVLCNPQILK